MTLEEAIAHNGDYALNHSIEPAIVVARCFKFALDFGATPGHHVYTVYIYRQSGDTPPQRLPGAPVLDGPLLYDSPDLTQVIAYLAQTNNPIPTHQLDEQVWT